MILAPHVLNDSIRTVPHTLHNSTRTRAMLFLIKCSDAAFDHPNVPLPVAQLITNPLQLVQPLGVHPDTLHKLTLPPADTQTMLPTNGLKLNFSPVMQFPPLHCLQHCLIHIIREHHLQGKVGRDRGVS